jgi:hypothetical protein
MTSTPLRPAVQPIIRWTYSADEWAAFVAWKRRQLFLDSVAWVVPLSAAAGGAFSYMRGGHWPAIIGFGFLGLLLSVVPTSIAWGIADAKAGGIARSPPEVCIRKDAIDYWGWREPLGGTGWTIVSANVQGGPLTILELTMRRDRDDEPDNWTLWVPVPCGSEPEARAFAAATRPTISRAI